MPVRNETSRTRLAAVWFQPIPGPSSMRVSPGVLVLSCSPRLRESRVEIALKPRDHASFYLDEWAGEHSSLSYGSGRGHHVMSFVEEMDAGARRRIRSHGAPTYPQRRNTPEPEVSSTGYLRINQSGGYAGGGEPAP
jgi:hypothetical protein